MAGKVDAGEGVEADRPRLAGLQLGSVALAECGGHLKARPVADDNERSVGRQCAWVDDRARRPRDAWRASCARVDRVADLVIDLQHCSRLGCVQRSHRVGDGGLLHLALSSRHLALGRGYGTRVAAGFSGGQDGVRRCQPGAGGLKLRKLGGVIQLGQQLARRHLSADAHCDFRELPADRKVDGDEGLRQQRAARGGRDRKATGRRRGQGRTGRAFGKLEHHRRPKRDNRQNNQGTQDNRSSSNDLAAHE